MDIRKRLRPYRIFWTLYHKWRRFRKNVGHNPSVGDSLVIVPCAPDTIGGSRGDEAMIVATIQHYSAHNPTIPIYIVTADCHGNDYVESLGYTNVSALECWNGPYPIEKIYREILSVRPSDVCIVGADCIDGFYSPYISLMLLALHDLLSKTQHVNSHLLAFSFNASPSRMMLHALKKTNRELTVNLRDAISQKRYKSMVGNAGLLADAAFSLQYDDDFEGYHKMKRWCIQQKDNGQKIIAFNLHPMLRKYKNTEDVGNDAKVLARNLAVIMDRHPEVSLVLVPHDDRQRISDNTMLKVVFSELRQHYQGRLYYDNTVYRAAQLKGLCGLFDALISSRMHLAIAALGREVPVMVAAYQGKFEGLFQHFGLPEHYVMSPQSFFSAEMIDVFGTFIDNLEKLQPIIKNKLPDVIALSKKNFL